MSRAFKNGMNFWLIAVSTQFAFIAAQLVVTVVASLREANEDCTFIESQVA